MNPGQPPNCSKLNLYPEECAFGIDWTDVLELASKIVVVEVSGAVVANAADHVGLLLVF